MTKVFIQIGWSRNIKGGQLITVSVNNNSVDMTQGEYLTSQAERHKRLFYMKPIDCKDGDLITLESKVGIRTLGVDEYNSFTAVFQVNESNTESEFKWAGVGYPNFPLIKGKINQVSIITAKELRESKIKAKINNEG